jgi:hypothetical protein
VTIKQQVGERRKARLSGAQSGSILSPDFHTAVAWLTPKQLEYGCSARRSVSQRPEVGGTNELGAAVNNKSTAISTTVLILFT